jgi:hypothetical protein
MGWWRWWRGPWPGHGPFSCLPPWERPGWALGGWAPYWPGYAYYDPESERRALEAYRLYLEDLRSWVEEEIKRVDKRLSELKSS